MEALSLGESNTVSRHLELEGAAGVTKGDPVAIDDADQICENGPGPPKGERKSTVDSIVCTLCFYSPGI